jgi:phosphate transport system substrate-binding protein
MTTKRRTLLFLLLAFALVAASCGGDDSSETTTAPTTAAPTTAPPATTAPSDGVELPPVDPLAVTGDIVTAGSSTVFPLSEVMAERFQDEGYGGQITIDVIGSGAGFERFCVAGEIDISNASRPIKDGELESCRSIGREPIEFRVGTDALAVTVSTGNTFVQDLTIEELAVAFSTAEKWSDVRAEFPDNQILRYSPGTDSGTFDYFVEEVFDEEEAPILSAGSIQFSELDEQLVEGIAGDGCDPGDASTSCAIGYFGYAYYQENAEVLTVIAIEGVEAVAENVDNGTYPLARPLFMYSTADIMAEKPQVAEYLNFFLSFVNEEIVDVGYFPAATSALDAAKRAWLSAVG